MRPIRRTLGVLALLAGAALLTPTAAEAQTTVSVSNLSQTNTSYQAIGNDVVVANAFTTGGTGNDRYTLNNVIIDIENAHDGALDVSIYNESSGNPGTKIGSSLSGTIGASAGNTTYSTSQTNTITLNGATTYFLYVTKSTGRRDVGTTANDAQTPTPSMWSATIADVGHYSSNSGTSWTNLTSGRSMRFTVNATAVDTTAPTVVSNGYSPADNATGIAVDANLTLTFNEAVQKGTGNITIRRTSDNTDINISVTSNQVTIGGTGANLNRIVTINPTANLDANTAYHVRIPAGVITDRAATPNNYAGISDATTWNFKTVDNVAPMVTNYSPADDATNVPVAANMVLTFNETVQAGTGNLTIIGAGDSRTIAVTGPLVTFSDKTVTIDPGATDLKNNTAYVVQIPAVAIKDSSNNNFLGITDNTTWNFTTVPRLAAPANVTAMPGNAQVSLSWNAVTGATGYEFQQKTLPSGACGTGSYGNWTSAGTASPFVVTSLMNGTRYCFRVRAKTSSLNGPPSAAVDATPVATAPMVVPTTTTNSAPRDTTAPTISSLTPDNGATGVAVDTDLVLTFNEPVKTGRGAITINPTSGAAVTIPVTDNNQVTIKGRTVTISPSNDLADGVSYHVLVPPGAIQDLAGNHHQGITDPDTWSFAMVDTTAPTISSFTPHNRATGVAVDTDLVLTFNEPVRTGSGAVTIKPASGAAVTIPVTDSDQVMVSGRTVTINPGDDLANGVSYHVLVPPGAIQDLAGNHHQGITDADAWSFTMADITAPTISSFTPHNRATGVALDTDLVLTFDEPVRTGSGAVTIKPASGAAVTIPVTDSDQVMVSGRTVTINPGDDLANGVSYHVLVPPGAIQDLAGNHHQGITDADAWSFTTTGLFSQGAVKAWNARFARTVADQVLDAVQGRMAATPVPGVELNVAGQQLGWIDGERRPTSESPTAARGPAAAPAAGGRHHLLSNASFSLAAPTPGGAMHSFWGRGAVTSFRGANQA